MKNILFLILIVLLTGCTILKDNNIGIISIKGSDTMLKLNQKLAEIYMEKNPGITIYVFGGGSKTGINALLTHSIDIAASSRPFEAEEIKVFAEKFDSFAIEYRIAKDGLSIYINENNPIKNFSINQIKDIFLGKITNWKDLGGDDHLIDVIIRPPSSGTYGYFKKFILENKDFTDKSKTIAKTEDIVEYIQKNKYAISYGGVGYGPQKLHANINGIEPSEKNVINDTYPITRYLYYYTYNNSPKHIKNFINWILSDEGQLVVKQVGYYPIWNIRY